MERKCINPECGKELPPGKEKYCSTYCQRKMQNARYYRSKKLGGIETNQQNDDKIMENEITKTEGHEQENFKLKLLSPGKNSFSPTNDPTVSYFFSEKREQLEMAIRYIDKLEDKLESKTNKIREQEKQIDDLKRANEKLGEQIESKNGLSGIMDSLRDDSGKIDFAGLGQMATGIIAGLKGAAAPSQLAGSDIPAEVAEYAKAFSGWFAGLSPEEKETAWTIINAMATDSDIMYGLMEKIQGDGPVRQAAN